MPRPASAWTLIDFGERLDQWALVESPSDDLQLLVTSWVLNRHTDPYRGMRRESDQENLWFGVVPGAYNGPNAIVCCSYWILEADRTVRCNQFATLRLPV